MAYCLVWEDQFNIDGKPNPSIWNIETGGHGFGNNEDQYYTANAKNIFVKDGLLNVVAYKEDYENRHYTSAKLTTQDKKIISYGKIEVMAKLPEGKGTWPAIWLLGQNMKQVGWPMCGEIDMVEHVGKNPNHFHFSLHAKDYNFHKNNQPTFVYQEDHMIEDFHEYSMVWDEKAISFFIDKKPMVRFEKGLKKTKAEWPYDDPFYLILNLAIGGWWGGEIDDKIFPVSMLIKYVKIYERRD